jgi:membrane associated rhomboid family serine protease
MLPLRDNAPTRSFPLVTVGLILANLGVFAWELSGRGLAVHVVRYGYYPCDLVSSCVDVARLHELPWYESAFTSMFMHGGWLHVLGNLLFLWIFGNNVEDALGKLRFLAFYVLGGLVATAVQSAVTLHYAGSLGESVPNVGASGAIAAVLGAYFVLLPRARVLTVILVFLREIPAWVFLGLWFAYQLWLGGGSLTHPEQGGGVAFFAHVGGFVFGVLAVKAFQTRQPLRPAY